MEEGPLSGQAEPRKKSQKLQVRIAQKQKSFDEHFTPNRSTSISILRILLNDACPVPTTEIRA